MKKKEYITIINEIGVPEKVEYGSDRYYAIEYINNKVAYLEKRLAEKGKELALYKTVVQDIGIAGIKEYGIEHVVDEIISADVKKIRHEVCEEIREKTQYLDDCWRIKEILDQIEKGERKNDNNK